MMLYCDFVIFLFLFLICLFVRCVRSSFVCSLRTFFLVPSFPLSLSFFSSLPSPPFPLPCASPLSFFGPLQDASNPFHGLHSQKIVYYSNSKSAGSGVAGVANRNLGNEGLFVEANKDYNGYFFAKSDRPVTLVAQFVDKKTNVTLGSATIPFAGGNWTQLNFTFTTTAGSECVVRVLFFILKNEGLN